MDGMSTAGRRRTQRAAPGRAMDTASLSDEELFRAALAGYGEAFSALFRRYQGPLYGFLARMVDEPTLAEDLLQEVFLRLFRCGRPIDHVKAWLYRVATNLVIDARRRYRREILTGDPWDADPGAARSETCDPGDVLARRDVLARALSTLTEDQRMVGGLHYFADQPIREVAQILELPEGTVKTRLARAYRRLAGALEQEEAP